MSEGKVVAGDITAYDDTEDEDPSYHTHRRTLDFVVLSIESSDGYSMRVYYNNSYNSRVEVASPDDYPVVGGVI